MFTCAAPGQGTRRLHTLPSSILFALGNQTAAPRVTRPSGLSAIRRRIDRSCLTQEHPRKDTEFTAHAHSATVVPQNGVTLPLTDKRAYEQWKATHGAGHASFCVKAKQLTTTTGRINGIL